MNWVDYFLIVWQIAVTVFVVILWVYVLKIEQQQYGDRVEAISELNALRDRVDTVISGTRLDLVKISDRVSDRVNDQAERSDDIETCLSERVDAAKAEAARALNAVRDLRMELPEIAQLVPKVNETRGWVTRFYREMKQDRYDLEKFQSDLEEWKVNNKTAFDDQYGSLKASTTKHRRMVKLDLDNASTSIDEMLDDIAAIAKRLDTLEACHKKAQNYQTILKRVANAHTETESNRTGDTPDTPAD